MERVQKSNNNHVVVTIDQTAAATKTKESPQAETISDPIPQTQVFRTKTLRCLSFSKPNSRFEENTHILSPSTILESKHQPINSHEQNYSSTDEEDDDEEWYEEEEEGGGGTQDKYKKKRRARRKINKRAWIEFTLFLIIMTCLIASLSLNSLERKKKCGLQMWKWCVMVMVVFCGRLVSSWVVSFLVFLIERNFMLREKVLYFVFGLSKSFRNCAWLALVLIAWMILFPGVHKHDKILKKVFRSLIAFLVGATIWLLKIVFVKVLASSFHMATYFDRMKESVFHHYILDTLSGPPLDEDERELPHHHFQVSKSLPPRLRGKSGPLSRSKQYGSRRIDPEKLKELSMTSRATAWSVRRLVNYVRSSGLSTISRTLDDFGKAESEITSEWEARNIAQRIFKHVAKPGAKYIEEEDLLHFLSSEEVDTIFPLFRESETRKISKSSFRNWVVHAYVERKALAHSLNDTKTAVHQLHKLASAIVIVIITVVSLLVMGLATTKMIVEEMNILTTVFLRYDNEKIYYPNSVLLTKPVSNYRRSPDMADTVDFCIDVSTPVDNITAFKKAIQAYIESKPKYWNPKHVVIMKEIENMNKMKMVLCVQHTMNHQNYGEKSIRRSELVFELKKIFESLGITYNLLPQEIHLTQFNTNNATTARMPM